MNSPFPFLLFFVCVYVIDDDIIVVGGGGDVVSILSNARFQNSRDDSDDSD